MRDRVYKNVMTILGANESARDSDRELLIEYMQLSGANLAPYQIEAIRHMPSFETITRQRRKLQSGGIFVASEGIQKARRTKAMVIQQNMPTASLETSERILDDVEYKQSNWF